MRNLIALRRDFGSPKHKIWWLKAEHRLYIHEEPSCITFTRNIIYTFYKEHPEYIHEE